MRLKLPTGEVFAIRRTRPPKEGAKDSIGWLDTLIFAVEVIRDASALVPFPYVKLAAGITVQVLLRIQTVRRNKDDFLDLSRKLVEVIITMRDTLCSSFLTRAPPPVFMTHGLDFVNKLLALQVEIDDLVRRTRIWTSFLKSTELAKLIGQYKEQINDLRSNFTLDVVVRMSLKASEAHMPRYLACTSNVLYFTDAMNDTVPVALDHCSSAAEFNEYVKFRFRKRVGRAIVERGLYILCLQLVQGAQRPLGLTDATWLTLIKPGVTITMDIVLKSTSGDCESDGHRCPSCRRLCVGVSPGDEIKCPCCATSFRLTLGRIEDSDASSTMHSQIALCPDRPLLMPDGTSEDCDIRYFRRFQVLMDVLRQTASVLIAEDNPIARQLLVRQLQRLQLNVIATGNGEEALAEWEARGPGYFSAALFDHHMPICDGAEATKRLRRLENERNCTIFLPVVALSADCQDSTRQLCLSAGMNAFFSKPVKKGDFTYMLSMLGTRYGA